MTYHPFIAILWIWHFVFLLPDHQHEDVASSLFNDPRIVVLTWDKKTCVKCRTKYDRINDPRKRFSQDLGRLALSLAIAHDPTALFLDQPTAGLDVGTRVELHNLIRELQPAGTTIILATHDTAEAEEMADRIAILLGGKLVTIGSPMEITATGTGLTKVSVRTQNGSLFKVDVTFPAVKQHGVKEDYSIYFSTDIGPSVSAIIAHIQASQGTLIDLRVERPSLEDRFLAITTLGVSQWPHF